MLILPDHWTWDFWLTQDGDTHHVFFLMAPTSLGDPDLRHVNARIGHAVSLDLIDWEFVGEAIGPGKPGDWDDQSTWTGSIIATADGWQMYYTGVRRSEGGLVQRIGRATSTDLYAWTKDETFILESDPRWYEQLDLDVWFDLTWRDPWVYFDAQAGEYRMLITARAGSGDVDARGVIGLARSSDLESWEVVGPMAEPGQFGHLEVPQLERIDGRWYLFFSAYEWAHSAERTSRGLAVAGTHYLVSDSSTGPFELADDAFFSGDAHGELYAGRVVKRSDGDVVFLAFLQYVGGGSFVGGLSDPFPITVGREGALSIDRGSAWRDHVPSRRAAARAEQTAGG